MIVSRILIKSFLGIQELDIKPGRFVDVTGPNGAGKSSIATAIQSIRKAGSLGKFIADGSDRAEVLLQLTDGDDVVSVREMITKARTNREVRRNGVVVKQTDAALSELFDSLSINPVEFVTGDLAKQKKWLLESLDFGVTTEDFAKHEVPLPYPLPEGAGVEALDVYQKTFYEFRHGANSQVRSLKATISNLESSLPAGDGEDVRQALEAAKKVEAAKREYHASYHANIARSLDAAIAEVTATCQKAVSDLEMQIKELQSQIAAAIAARDADIKQFRAEANSDQGYAKAKSDLQAAVAAVEVATKDMETYQRATGVRAELKKQGEALEKAEQEAEHWQRCMDNLAALKLDILSRVPIKGLEIKDGEFWYRGHLLDTQNTASKLALAVKVAAARCKAARLVCIDGCECLDSASLEGLKALAEKENLQLVITRVVPDATELEVRTEA